MERKGGIKKGKGEVEREGEIERERVAMQSLTLRKYNRNLNEKERGR